MFAAQKIFIFTCMILFSLGVIRQWRLSENWIFRSNYSRYKIFMCLKTTFWVTWFTCSSQITTQGYTREGGHPRWSGLETSRREFFMTFFLGRSLPIRTFLFQTSHGFLKNGGGRLFDPSGYNPGSGPPQY